MDKVKVDIPALDIIKRLTDENKDLKDRLDRYDKQRIKRNNYYAEKYRTNEEYRKKKNQSNKLAYMKRKNKNNLTIY